ncbi:alpha-1,3/1,6-mannosyltransferase ALG2 [Quillaja saponaria]|uniref:Alpha-1,3/1,6-mannosyltransferase ALG2 n=1 Tax=Quillaja saponaria TaxID=32244 RepID=A0AAD7KZP2_QUISA|nr:alpha-1,3/1,6-mannosyltransferase ALG2 [Quillaja saponaria]
MVKARNSKMNIAIIHPDLGIGGAERLIVDAAVELSSLGHKCSYFYCTPMIMTNTLRRLLYLSGYCIWLFPSSAYFLLLSCIMSLCASLRCIFASFCMLITWPLFDDILADQVSAVIPILKLKKSPKVVFYCHFPDLLLAEHTTIFRRIYRKPIDIIEELTTGMVDLILVNSCFTGSTFACTFKHFNSHGFQPAILYPAVNVDQFEEPHSSKLNFLSINRFERKKNIELAISAFAMLCTLEGDVLTGCDISDASLTLAAV